MPSDFLPMDVLSMSEKCIHPHCDKDGERYRQNTAYVNEESNWVVLCPEHIEENEAYWADMWAEYYSGCM